MKKQTTSRRDFLKYAMLTSGAAFLASCQPALQPTPQIIKETVEVPVEVKSTVEVTKVVQVQVQAPAATNGYGYVEWHPSEPVEIEFWGHNFNNSAGEGAQDRRTTDAFEKMYPEIKVKRVNNDWGGTVGLSKKLPQHSRQVRACRISSLCTAYPMFAP